MKREDLLLLLTILLFLQGYLFESVFAALLGFSIVVYLLYLHSEFIPSIKAERRINSRLREGVRARSVLKLKNLTGKRFGIRVLEDLPPGFTAEEPAFQVAGYEERKVDYYIIPAKGAYRLKGPRIRVTDARGLYYTDFFVDSEIEVEVYPSISRIREEVRAKKNVELAKRYQKALQGFRTMEIHSLRRFQLGDDTKLVDWKATARLGELIVKEFLREVESEIYIILDSGREMRKGIRSSRIDYASILTLQLAYLLRGYRIGLMIYDEFGVICKLNASKSPEQIERISRSLKLNPIRSSLFSLKIPELRFRISEESRMFLKRVIPTIKGRMSSSTGLVDALGHLQTPSFLIFIADITSNTTELIRVLSEARNRHKVLLLTPNPILFFDVEKLDKKRILWLYRRYLEREELIKKLSRIVPVVDLGPSDYIDAVRRVIE
jgi:uncharacterized protein (DUF58 family)